MSEPVVDRPLRRLRDDLPGSLVAAILHGVGDVVAARSSEVGLDS